jgi:hypothetical protein
LTGKQLEFEATTVEMKSNPDKREREPVVAVLFKQGFLINWKNSLHLDGQPRTDNKVERVYGSGKKRNRIIYDMF